MYNYLVLPQEVRTRLGLAANDLPLMLQGVQCCTIANAKQDVA